MSKRLLAAALLLGIAALGGWAVAQQNPPDRQGFTGRPPSAGRYTTMAVGQTAILLDTGSGRSWVMMQGSDDTAWVPAQKFDTSDAARQWLAAERQRAEAQTMLQREMANRLEDLQRDMTRRLDTLRSEQRRSAAPGSSQEKK